MEISNNIALVTGASRGIGRGIALELANHGFSVIGTATTLEGANKITEYGRKEGVKKLFGMQLDVRDEASIEHLIKNINEQFGAPTILVNNAGVTRDNIILRMKDEEWGEVINTNLTAIFKLTKACVRGMTKAKWGRIVNIGSVVSSMGNAGQSNYAAAKAGLEGFSRSLAKELGSRNITVNTIAPGFIQTDMTDKLSDEQKQALVKSIPLQRLGEVGDIYPMVKLLCSEAGSYISGQTIHINGGMYL